MTGDLVAQLKGASFSYYGAPETLHAVDLDVHAGECVVLMGASGSGKTTIVRVLNGLAGGYYRGSVSGDVFLGGLLRAIWRRGERAELVGSVFQDPTAQVLLQSAGGRGGVRVREHRLSRRGGGEAHRCGDRPFGSGPFAHDSGGRAFQRAEAARGLSPRRLLLRRGSW